MSDGTQRYGSGLTLRMGSSPIIEIQCSIIMKQPTLLYWRRWRSVGRMHVWAPYSIAPIWEGHLTTTQPTITHQNHWLSFITVWDCNPRYPHPLLYPHVTHTKATESTLSPTKAFPRSLQIGLTTDVTSKQYEARISPHVQYGCSSKVDWSCAVQLSISKRQLIALMRSPLGRVFSCQPQTIRLSIQYVTDVNNLHLQHTHQELRTNTPPTRLVIDTQIRAVVCAALLLPPLPHIAVNVSLSHTFRIFTAVLDRTIPD